MPRPAKAKVDAAAASPSPAEAESDHNPVPIVLPTDAAAFAALVGSLRTSEHRLNVYEKICIAFRGYPRLWARESLDGLDPAQIQLFEERALELTREPHFNPDFPDSIDNSLLRAWHGLILLRSRRFAERLTTWAASPNEHLAAEAIQYLAWMGRVEDLRALTAIIAHSDRRQVCAVARGCELAVLHNQAEPGFAAPICELLTEFIRGTSSLRGPSTPGTWVDDATSTITDLLLQCDRQAAIRLFASSQVLRPDNPAVVTVVYVLGYMVERRTDVPAIGRAIDPAAIKSVYMAVSNPPAEYYPRRLIHASALLLGVLADPEFFAAEIKTLRPIAKEDPELRRAISIASRFLRGVPNAEALISQFPSLRERLQPPASEVLAAGYFVLQVMGDGLAVTLHNDSDLWPAAARGLELIGKRSAAAALTKAATLAFGPQAASITPGQATELMASLLENLPPELDMACTRFEQLSEAVFAAVQRYIDRKPKPFRL